MARGGQEVEGAGGVEETEDEAIVEARLRGETGRGSGAGLVGDAGRS